MSMGFHFILLRLDTSYIKKIMLLKYKNDYSIKKNILIFSIWGIVLYILVNVDYVVYIDLFQESNNDIHIIISTLVLFGFIGLLLTSKISRLYTLLLAYLVIYESLISNFIEEFSEIFYMHYTTVFFDLFVIYILNTKEVLALFQIERIKVERYSFILFFFCLSILLFIKSMK